MIRRKSLIGMMLVALGGVACEAGPGGAGDSGVASSGATDIQRRMGTYTSVTLAADTTGLTPNERRMIPILIDAAKAMDPIYWMQAWGSRDSLMARISDPVARQYAEINYGPYDRLDNSAAFIPEVGTRPPGANL